MPTSRYLIPIWRPEDAAEVLARASTSQAELAVQQPSETGVRGDRVSINDLVQIGEAEYVIPNDVIRIYRGEPFVRYKTGEMEPATTYVVVRTASIMGGYLGTQTDSEQVVCSKWPIDRVRAALGLTDSTPMHDEFERIADDEGGVQ
jgi:hypothetical protein